jgi:hypothetical protein
VSYPYDGSHLKNGVTSNNQAYITAMVQDLWDRGFDGLLGNWKGGANTCTYPTFNSACGSSSTNTQRDGAYSKAIATMLANHPTMKFGFVYDSSAFASECSSDANEPKCVQLKIDADLDYADTAYFASANYIKDASSKPIVLFFIDESSYFSQCTGGAPCNLTSGTCVSQSACWTSVWSGVNSHTTAQGVPLAMVFENSGGFSHTQSAGAFAWQQPPSAAGASITQSTQEDWKGGTYLDNWYNNANTTYASKLAFGLALKGFDSETASWYYPNGRVIAQQCGQVWLNSFAMNNGHPNVNYIQVSTWDDYEEGSEIETGIDNCFSAPTLSLASSTLTITLHKTDATYATTNTISSLKLWVSQDSTNYALLDTLPVLTTSVNLASYGVLTVGQTYQFKIQAVGQPGISNQISAATTYTRDSLRIHQLRRVRNTMKLIPSDNLLKHLLEQNVTMPLGGFDIPDTAYADIDYDLRRHPIHSGESQVEIKDRVDYAAIWRFHGVAQNSGATGQALETVQKTASLTRQIVEMADTHLPNVAERVSAAIDDSKNVVHAAVSELKSITHLGQQDIVQAVAGLKMFSAESHAEVLKVRGDLHDDLMELLGKLHHLGKWFLGVLIAGILFLCAIGIASMILGIHAHAQSVVIIGAQKGTTNSGAVTASDVDANHKALDVSIVAGGGTGGGPADTAPSATASESDVARQKVTSVMRLWDQTGLAGAQLVTARGDLTSGLWVNCKNGCAGGSTTPTDAFANPDNGLLVRRRISQ